MQNCCLHDFIRPVCLSSFSLQDLTSTQSPSISQEAPGVVQTSAPSCDEDSVSLSEALEPQASLCAHQRPSGVKGREV